MQLPQRSEALANRQRRARQCSARYQLNPMLLHGHDVSRELSAPDCKLVGRRAADHDTATSDPQRVHPVAVHLPYVDVPMHDLVAPPEAQRKISFASVNVECGCHCYIRLRRVRVAESLREYTANLTSLKLSLRGALISIRCGARVF